MRLVHTEDSVEFGMEEDNIRVLTFQATLAGVLSLFVVLIVILTLAVFGSHTVRVGLFLR
jgi:hypothetical protein